MGGGQGRRPGGGAPTRRAAWAAALAGLAGARPRAESWGGPGRRPCGGGKAEPSLPSIKEGGRPASALRGARRAECPTGIVTRQGGDAAGGSGRLQSD